MDFNQIQGTINDALMVAGVVVIVLIGAFFVARRWIYARLLGVALLVVATQAAPADVVAWAPLVLAAATIGSAYFITRSINQPTTEQLIIALRPTPLGDIRSRVAAVPAALRARSVRGAATAMRDLGSAAGIRRIYVWLAGITLAAVMVGTTFRLGAWAFVALVLSAVLLGTAFLMRRAMAMAVVVDPQIETPIAEPVVLVVEPTPVLEA